MEDTMGRKHSNSGRGKWAGQTEYGRATDGTLLSKSNAGTEGYIHTTYPGGSRDTKGKTTLHAKSGDVHKHGAHSAKPTKGNFSRGNSPGSSRKFLSGLFKF